MAQLGGARGADAAAAAASVLSWVFAVWAAASHEGVHDGVCATCPRRGLFTCTGPGGCTRTSCRKLNDVARSAQAAAVLSLILVSLLVLLRIGACLGRLPPLLDPAVERAPAAHIGAAAGFLIACALAAALWDAGFCGQPAARNTPGLRLGPSPFLFIAASLLQVAAAAAARHSLRLRSGGIRASGVAVRRGRLQRAPRLHEPGFLPADVALARWRVRSAVARPAPPSAHAAPATQCRRQRCWAARSLLLASAHQPTEERAAQLCAAPAPPATAPGPATPT
eukprot:TRINITY_DN11909_c0_g1_i3.p2 TRINITY_DN11909_c0_g1~~TRINITY_DN11909_c0_g1_i3.p2  ORF type:complete len:281 (+),score=52.27 TRINITY_DN11909_c0_g1_i3:64-906(+)